MNTLKELVCLANSGWVEFIVVVLMVLLAAWFIYMIFRICRDLEVFILELKRSEDEPLERKEDPDL